MKLVRFGETGQEKPGLVDDDGVIRDLSGTIPDITAQTLAGGLLNTLATLDPSGLPAVTGVPRLGPCVGHIGKFMCIGLNYADHAAETGMAAPEHPILFMKANSAICGPNDPIVLPRSSVKTDWEVELGVVIGKPAKYVSKAEALDHVAGYCVINDVSERHFQSGLTGQWTKGKSCDTFGPVGPWFVTADEVKDPQNLDLWLDVNGKPMQRGNTSTMIFPIAEIIEHLSSLMTLHPGDVIATGTPPGVGLGIKPEPVFLKPGDRLELGISGLGSQSTTVVADN